MVSPEARRLCKQALVIEMTDVIAHLNVQYLNSDEDDHHHAREQLAELGLVMGPSKIHGTGVHSLVSEKGHDSQGIMRADILSAVERSRKSSKAPKFPVGDKVEVLTADQLAERYPEGDSQYVVKTHNGRYLDFRNAQDVAWMRFNDCDSNPTHTVQVWEGEKTDENPTGSARAAV